MEIRLKGSHILLSTTTNLEKKMRENTLKKELRQEWRTPPEFIQAIQREFRIDIDVAASAENCVVQRHYNKERDGLHQRWFIDSVVCAWCNPGFSSIGAWVDKAITEVSLVPWATAILMVLASPSTKWWAQAEQNGAEIRLLAPRVQFLPPPAIVPSSNARENALLIFRSENTESRIFTWRWKPANTGRVA